MKEDNALVDSPIVVRVESSGVPITADDMLVVYEDDGQEELGEWPVHTTTSCILHNCIMADLDCAREYNVFANLDLHYHPINPRAYLSPDVMVVRPSRNLPEDICSYRIDEDGPAPVLVIEILSHRSAQQGDLTFKPEIYSKLKAPEFILVDVTGTFLEQRLLLRKLQADGVWCDSQDPDGGVTSALGFRLIVEDDRKVRVVNAKNGRCYVRPDEIDRILRIFDEVSGLKTRTQEMEARNREMDARICETESRNRELEAEIERLKRSPSAEPRN